MRQRKVRTDSYAVEPTVVAAIGEFVGTTLFVTFAFGGTVRLICSVPTQPED